MAVAILAGTFWVIAVFLRTLSSIAVSNPQAAAGMITAFATVVVSVVSVLIAKYRERQTAIEAALRVKKVPAYEKVMDVVFNLIYSGKLNKPGSDQETLQSMVDMTRD